MPAAAICAVAAIGSSMISSRAAAKASDAQTAASENAILAQQASENRALALQAPQRQAGYQALAAMMDMAGLDRGRMRAPIDPTDLNADPDAPDQRRYIPRTVVGAASRRALGRATSRVSDAITAGTGEAPDLADFDPYNFEADPGYQFRMDEGMRSVERGAAARGGLLSGGYGRRAIRYAQDYASSEYQRVFDRISTIAGYGNSSSSHGASTIVNTGANVGNAMVNAGEARGSGYLAQGNASANLTNQLGQLGGYAAHWYQNRGVNTNSSDPAVSSYLNM